MSIDLDKDIIERFEYAKLFKVSFYIFDTKINLYLTADHESHIDEILKKELNLQQYQTLIIEAFCELKEIESIKEFTDKLKEK